jgi:hypothetical protein
MMCCTYNGLIGLYHAWESIVRGDGGGVTARVNLLLNRASPWLDIDSHLPWEGRVVIRNRTARRVAVRIPRWVDDGAVRTTVNGRGASPWWMGRMLVFDPLAGGDTVEMTFPMAEHTERYSVGWPGIHVPGWTEVTKLLEVDKQPSPDDYQVSAVLTGSTPPPRPVFTIRLRGNDAVEIAPREAGNGYPLYRREHMAAGGKAPTRKVTRTLPARLFDV